MSDYKEVDLIVIVRNKTTGITYVYPVDSIHADRDQTVEQLAVRAARAATLDLEGELR